MKRYIVWDTDITRDANNVAISVEYTLKSYSEQGLIQKEFVIDEFGNTAIYDIPVYDENNFLDSRIVNYDIPEEDRTACCHSNTHPHVHEDEIEFQQKNLKWFLDASNTDVWITAIQELDFSNTEIEEFFSTPPEEANTDINIEDGS